MHQLAELLRLFDAICSRGWQRKGVTGQQIRKQGAALHRELPRPATGLRRAARPGAPAWPAASTATTLFFIRARAVASSNGEPRNQPRYRGERRESTVPLFRDWKEWQGDLEPGTSGPRTCSWRGPGYWVRDTSPGSRSWSGATCVSGQREATASSTSIGLPRLDRRPLVCGLSKCDP